MERGKDQLFKKEIFRTLPDALVYRRYFKDIEIRNDKLVVTKDMYENPVLFELR